MSEVPNIKHAGLKECCIEFVTQDGRTADELQRGDELVCPTSSHRVVYRDGNWQWKGPE